MTLDTIAKAVVALFPVQETESGQQVVTHRVETSPVKEDANKLDVVIVQVYPTPARRFELVLELQPAPQLVSHPKRAEDSAMAQLVAMRLQQAAGLPIDEHFTSFRNEAGLFATRFRLTDAPAVEAKPELAPKRPKAPAEASV